MRYLARQQYGLIKAAPAQPLRMQRHRNDRLCITLAEKFFTAARHEVSQRLAQSDLASIFKFLNDLPKRMLCRFFPWITGPGAGPAKVWSARKTNSAPMIISTRIWKWPSTKRTQRMGDKLDIRPAGGAEILFIAAVDETAARPTPRRIKPIDQPVQSVGKRLIASGCHQPPTL
jgi:hypothetical protein